MFTTVVKDGTAETHHSRLRDCRGPTCPTSRFYHPKTNRMPGVSSTSKTFPECAGYVPI